MSYTELLDCELSWSLPHLLRLPEPEWQDNGYSANEETTERIQVEERKLEVLKTVVVDNILLNNISSLPKIKTHVICKLLPISYRFTTNYPSMHFRLYIIPQVQIQILLTNRRTLDYCRNLSDDFDCFSIRDLSELTDISNFQS